MRSIQDKRFEELSAENKRLRADIEVLQHRIDNLLGREGSGNRLGLTDSEYRIAHLLAHSGGRVVSKTALFEARKGYSDPKDFAKLKIVDVLISKIRKKLAAYGIEIETVWRAGYFMSHKNADRFYEQTYEDLDLAA